MKYGHRGVAIIRRAMTISDEEIMDFEDELAELKLLEQPPNLMQPNALEPEARQRTHIRRRGMRALAMRTYSVKLRNKYGAIKDTPAMRRVIHETAYKLLKDDHWRDVDIASVLPHIVELAFVPTEYEEEASFIGDGWAGAEVATRQKRVRPILA